ncbi:MAG TPA: hypothetical protein VNS09_24710 [Solirubrobacter sp.]|nr:hypothetical protein [Solirubrobacter sp.]
MSFATGSLLTVAAGSLLGLPAGDATPRATCSTAALDAPVAVHPQRDVVFGSLVLPGARRLADRRPNAFRHRGYKLAVTLPKGTEAVLSVPREMRGRVGLVYTHKAEKQTWRRGLDGAETAVRFTACAPDANGGRTGWPGGLIVDRRRCVTLVVSVRGTEPVRRRVPLGRAC